MPIAPGQSPQPAPPGPPHGLRPRERSSPGTRDLIDLAFKAVCLAATLVVPVLVALLTASLLIQSRPAFTELGFRFFISSDWDPNQGLFGAVPFIYGTLTTSAIALLIAVPLSVGAAAFLAEIAPGWLRRTAPS